jgi:hypothetical protein
LDAKTSRTPIRQLARQLAQSLPNHTAGTIRNHIDLIKKVLAENPELLAWLNDPALQENAIEILWQMTKAWIKKMREARATKPKKTRTTKEPDVLEVNAPDTARNGQPWDPEEDVRLIQTLCFFKHNGNDIREQQAILCREFNRNFEEIKNHGRALFQASLSLFGKGIWQYLKSHCTPTLPWKQAVERVFMNPPPNPEDFNGPQGMNAIRYFNQNWDETGGVISTIELLQKEIARQRAESNQPVQVAD